MPAPSLRVEVAEGVATLTLDRHGILQVLNRALPGESGTALDQVQADRAVGALILTGTEERGPQHGGTRAFVVKRPACSRGR